MSWGVGVSLVFGSTSRGLPACTHAVIAARSASLSFGECAKGALASDASHGGMYLVLVTRSSPAPALAASPAVSRRHSPSPEPPLLWHDAQLRSRIGCTVRANDGPALD